MKQEYIRRWMEEVLGKNKTGDQLQESYLELLPPETLFSREALNGRNAPRMYQEIRDLILAQGCQIQKRRGLQIKKALASFYGEEQATKDALDLCRELVEDGMKNIASR